MQNWDSERRQNHGSWWTKTSNLISITICFVFRVAFTTWLKPRCLGWLHFIQQDGARPHTAERTIEDLEIGGAGNGFVPIIVTQPPNSPDLNINDLGFFGSLKVDVKRIFTHCTSREKVIANVIKAFDEYPREKIDGLWACWFNILRNIVACDGGNDYK